MILCYLLLSWKMSQDQESHTIQTGPVTVSQNHNASSTHKVSFITTQIHLKLLLQAHHIIYNYNIFTA